MITTSEILDCLVDGIFVVDRDWRIAAVNAAAAALVSRPRDAVIGAVLWDVFPSPGEAGYERAARRVLATGQALEAAPFCDPRTGVWLSVHIAATSDGLLVRTHDITADRAAECARRESAGRLLAVFEASPFAIYAWQRTGGDFELVDFNEAAARETNGGIQQYLGAPLSSFYADTPEIQRLVHASANADRVPHRQEMDYVFRTTGERRRVAMTFVGATSDLVLVYGEDLTEQHDAQTLSRGLTDQSITGVYVFQGGTYVYVNPRFAEMLGYSVAEVYERSGWKWFVHESSWDEVARKSAPRERGQNERVSYTIRAVRRDGTTLDIEVHATSITYRGQPALLGTIIDVTSRKQSEDARLALAEYVRLLLESTTEGLYGIDARGHITFINAAGAAVLGYSPDELIGAHAHSRIHHTREDGTAYPRAECPMTAAYAAAEPIRVARDVFWHRDGVAVPVSYAAAPIREGEETVGVVVAFADETYRRGAELELHRREEQLTAIVSIQQDVATSQIDLSQIMDIIVTRTMGLTSAEGVAVELLEGTEMVYRAAAGMAASFVGLRLNAAGSLSGLCVRSRELVQCDDSETDPRVDREACRKIGVRSMVIVPLLHEGIAIGVLKLMSSQASGFGEQDVRTLRILAGLLGTAIARGIEQQTREALGADRSVALETLRVREAHFRSLIENASDPIILVDADGRPTYASPAFGRVLGYESSDVLRLSSTELVHPDDIECAKQMLADLVSGRDETVSGELRMRHATGAYRTLACTSRSLLSDAAVRGIVVNLRDVSEQKSLEEQLRQAMKMDAVGRLAGGIAHDFNNLLTVISGNAEFLDMRLPAADPSREEVNEIRQSTARAAGLTRQLLAFSRQQVLRPREIDINTTVSDLARMLGRLIGEDIHLDLQLHPDTAMVMADPGQMEQVIVNLVVNARDAMPKGGRLTIATDTVRLDEHHVDAHEGVRPGPYVRLTVTDTGHGMDEATLARMFEPFFTTKPLGTGTGLGLSTAYGIIRQSNGFIWAYSEPDHGTVIKLYLPSLVDVPSLASTTLEPTAPVHIAAAGGETLLLVEDADAVRNVARRILQNLGYIVMEATNGHQALSVAAAFDGHIDALVTDAVMPGMGGRDLAEALRSARPDIRVLYMSGYTDDDIIRRGLLEPGSLFLEKPFTAQRLARAVKDVLE
jgi:PAS domain S-box-containing protein